MYYGTLLMHGRWTY